MKSPDSAQNRNPNQQDPNRDPLTGEPRSHPLGTGVGAIGGGLAGGAAGAAAAGAAAGSAAGPIGTGIGAAAGAVIGGLAGKAGAEAMNPTRGGDLERFIDYKVVDRDDDKIGTIDAVWEDHTGEPTYLAIRTGWLGLGKAHVVPAHQAEVNEERRKVRLPFSADQIKNAPTFDSQDEIDANAEFTISEHFHLSRQPAPDTPLSRREETQAPDRRSDNRREATRGNESGDARMRLKSEDLKIGKREVDAGGVRLRKIVRTETVNRPVELQHEEIVVERVPTEGEGARAGDERFEGEEIYIPLRREEAVVEKTTRTREEVRVGKKRETERTDIAETVRHEDVEIEHEGEGHAVGHYRDDRHDRL
jgi:uncharacterized protein (TIGR02271 family)